MTWNTDTYFLRFDRRDLPEAVYDRVCRTNFEFPGFCLVDLGRESSSIDQRRFMIELKQRLQQIHQRRLDRDILFVSAARFDQQVTTKFHRDGGPAESLLILGYEPSAVVSEVSLADYSLCARERGLSPQEFLERHNPMFAAGADLLLPYTTRVSDFCNDKYQVLVINNSEAIFSSEMPRWQGVLHTAAIRHPSESHRRVINSIQVASVSRGTSESLSDEAINDFATTSQVRRQGYDKLHLADDR